MEVQDLDKWFTSLTVSQKERIARKIVEKGFKTYEKTSYPSCTRIWNKQPVEYKQSIHDHCTDKHGLLLPEWREGKVMSY